MTNQATTHQPTYGVAPAPHQLVMGGFVGTLAVGFGYGCLVSWPVLALGYWGILALFLFHVVNSWREEQVQSQFAAFISLDMKQHEKKLKDEKKKKQVLTNQMITTSKKPRAKKVAKAKHPEADAAEVEENEDVKEITIDLPVLTQLGESAVALKKKDKIKKPRAPDQRMENEVKEVQGMHSPNFEEGVFEAVLSAERKKRLRAEKQHQEDSKKIKAEAANPQINAHEASAQAEHVLQELENLTPKHKQLQQKQQSGTTRKVAAPNYLPKVVRLPANAMQQKPMRQKLATEKEPKVEKKVPPPGVSIWELRAQERADAKAQEELARSIAESEEFMMHREASVCLDYATFGVCPRGNACMWMHQIPDVAMEVSNQIGNETILYKRGMLKKVEEDKLFWSREDTQPAGDDLNEGFSSTDKGDFDTQKLDTQKTPLTPGALPFLPWAVREEFSTQFNLSF